MRFFAGSFDRIEPPRPVGKQLNRPGIEKESFQQLETFLRLMEEETGETRKLANKKVISHGRESRGVNSYC